MLGGDVVVKSKDIFWGLVGCVIGAELARCILLGSKPRSESKDKWDDNGLRFRRYEELANGGGRRQ